MKKLYVFILALMIVLVSLVGALAIINPQSLNEYHDRRFWFAKIKAPATDLLVLGDSRIYRGFNPENGLNFAFSSNSYTDEYLNMAMAKIKARGIVILGITPQSLTDYNLDDHFRLMRDQSQNIYSESLFLLETIIPRAQLFTFMSGEKLPWESYPQDARVIYHSNGWMETFVNQKNVSMGKSAYADAFRSNPFNPAYVDIIVDFIKKAMKEKEARVYLVYPPTSKEVYDLEHTFEVSKMNVFNEIKKIQEQTGAEFIDIPEMHVLDTFDGDHIDSVHAKSYTKAVMHLIGQRP